MTCQRVSTQKQLDQTVTIKDIFIYPVGEEMSAIFKETIFSKCFYVSTESAFRLPFKQEPLFVWKYEVQLFKI